MSKHHWLEVAEYTSLAGSVAGLVATVVSQQVVYTAAPLTLSLSLGALNRQRLEQRTQQKAQATLTQIHSVNQVPSSAPESLTSEEVQAQINAVKQAVSRLHNNTKATIREVRLFLANELESLREQLQTELNQLPQAFDSAGLEQRVEQLATMIAPLPQTMEAVKAQRQQIADLSQGIAVLEQRFGEIPTLPDLSRIEAAIAQLSQGLAAVEACLAPLQAIDLSSLQAAIAQLQTDVPQQADLLTSLPSQLQQLSRQVKHLEDINRTLVKPYLSQLAAKLKPTTAAIAQLNHRLETLGQRTMTGLERQKLEQLGQVASDLQQRFEQLSPSLEPFDPSPLQADIQAVRAQAADLQEQLKAVRWRSSELNTSALEQQVETMAGAIAHLEQRSQEFLTRQDLSPWQQAAIAPLEAEISNLHGQLEALTQEFMERPEQEAIPRIETKISELDTWVQDLDTSLEDLHDYIRITQQKLEMLAPLASVGNLEDKLTQLSEKMVGQVDQVVECRVAEVNALLAQTQSAYKYELVIDRSGSRNCLIEALDRTQQRLVLVCPWPSRYSINNQLLQKLRAALNRGSQIDIGWGHLKDVEKGTLEEGWSYNALPLLKELEAAYPDQLRLSLLGTHEKFLVCDRSFAMLGSHNFLTSGSSSPEREVGLYTTDPRLVDALIARFEDGVQRYHQLAG